MSQLPTRKNARLRQYDYSTPGAYFITICTANREKLFWSAPSKPVGADIIRLQNVPLSELGGIVEKSILQIGGHYDHITVDQYCIMPDHVHLLLSIHADEHGRIISAPTVSTVVGSMKRWVSRQIGRPIWQKSFYEHSIRNQRDYDEIWEYIENNPLKYLLKEKI